MNSSGFISRVLGLGRKAKVNDVPRRSTLSAVNLPSMAFYKGLTYDNTYPAINKIAGEFMMIRPYAIDGNGKPIDSPVIDALYHPNQSWSGLYFREVLAVMALVHPKVYVLVWRKDGRGVAPGGAITPNNIAGFTVLEGVTERIGGGSKIYQCGDRQYTEGDVIELYAGVDPYNLSRGYSPSSAVKKWANLDDYIAAYQAGYFENGAVPSGQFIITARSADEFNDIVDKMQSHHRGSGRNNNVMYTHRPVNAMTGSPEEAQIEWVPFANSNRDLSLGELFEQANKKIDSSFGVPASVRGVNDANTYASVRVDEQLFLRYTVKPFATRIWTQFTHELNRLTGGLGFAITFDLDIPGVADELNIDADRKSKELNIIISASSAGYSLDSIVDAFDLPVRYKLLKMNEVAPVIDNHKPEVDEGGEVESTPDQEMAKTIKKIAADHGDGVNHASVREKFIKKITDSIQAVTVAQVDAAVKDYDKVKKDNHIVVWPDQMINGVAADVDSYMQEVGEDEFRRGLELLIAADVSVEDLPIERFVLSKVIREKYINYLRNNVFKSYTEETAAQIRRRLAEAQAAGLDKEQTADLVRGLVGDNEWRAQRLARTEEHKIYGDTSVAAMTQLSELSGKKIVKRWRSNVGDPCEFCRAMDGKTVDVNHSFVSVGQSVEGVDGGKMLNNFVDVESACLHPHCMCWIQYEVVDK